MSAGKEFEIPPLLAPQSPQSMFDEIESEAALGLPTSIL